MKKWLVEKTKNGLQITREIRIKNQPYVFSKSREVSNEMIKNINFSIWLHETLNIIELELEAEMKKQIPE